MTISSRSAATTSAIRRRHKQPRPPLPIRHAAPERPAVAVSGARRQSACPSALHRARLRLVGLTLCGLLSSGAALAANANAHAKDTPPVREVADKRNDLKDLRGQIEAMRKDLANAEGSRADAADQLKDVEREISIMQRDLRDLATQRSDLQAALARLATQSRDMESRVSGQQQQLEQLIRHHYLQGDPDVMRLLLNGDDPNQIARDLHYLAAVGHARGELVHEIENALAQKQALAADTRERAAELAQVEAQQKAKSEALVQRREQRRAALEKISARISAQRKEIGAKERDERRLTQLVDRLAKIIAARPAPRREAPPAEKPAERSPERNTPREERGRPTPAKPETRPTEIVNERTPQAQDSGSFARLKGDLRLPVRGTISNRFGSARPEGGTWKGLFVRAAAGSEVRAIASGRVVFADWMRGFGNLLIVDHSDGYLSIYGNNDALLKQVGDNVRGGDAIAAVGDSGGNPESGLYFELRHQGQPLDPLKWVSVR
ncbi:peptidoglycan DD-metalloendopeptidase family protein [Rhodocyclus tenuis]|uniref:Peptidoglycan DD-metalloendopeptidase family protein n=1 Tax=Rhodocyclus tenuis TaxID=1066 RepID=A0A6L5JVQ8_RHOTE|nr:peptidoglycan DD-metalloendopeptidase family protein [Rhodocyclus gracilis]